MANTHVEFTQHLLDGHHPGKEAKLVLAEFGLDLLRNDRPDILLLPSMLYDAFGQAKIRSKDSDKIMLNDPSFLLKELLYRHVKNNLGEAFVQQSGKLFDQASTYRLNEAEISRAVREIKRHKGYQAIHRDGEALIQDLDELTRKVYLMGDAKRIIFDIGHRQLRPLYNLEVKGILNSLGDSSERRENPFRIPALEEIRKRLDDAYSAVDQMPDRELCIRTIRSLGKATIAERAVDLPVYGVKTVYAYAPIIMDRVLNGWSFDNQPVIDDLSEQMSQATAKLKSMKQRFDRLQSEPSYG
jgi:hypothetical protein